MTPAGPGEWPVSRRRLSIRTRCGGRCRIRSDPAVFVRGWICSPAPLTRTTVALMCTVPAVRSSTASRIAHASPMRTPVPSMNSTKSGRSSRTAVGSARSRACRSAASGTVSARTRLRGQAIGRVSRTGLTRSAPWRTAQWHRLDSARRAARAGCGPCRERIEASARSMTGTVSSPMRSDPSVGTT